MLQVSQEILHVLPAELCHHYIIKLFQAVSLLELGVVFQLIKANTILFIEANSYIDQETTFSAHCAQPIYRAERNNTCNHDYIIHVHMM